MFIRCEIRSWGDCMYLCIVCVVSIVIVGRNFVVMLCLVFGCFWLCGCVGEG